VQELLRAADVAVTLYQDVVPDPSCFSVDAAAKHARSVDCNLVVGLGGGSAIDFAKGVAVAASHAGRVWDYVTYTGANAMPVTPAVLPVLAVPTTAGTGSEVTKGIVLENPDRTMKAALLSEHVYPKVALIDPELTYTMPVSVTAMTGFDALSHGIEAYLNATVCNPLSDLVALDAVRRVARSLPLVLADGDDQDGRAEMAWAATLGGMAIALSNTTVAHAMGLPLGARLGVPHGLGLSRLLPVVLEHSWQDQPERCSVLADVVGAGQPDMRVPAKAQAFVSWLRQFVQEIGLHELWSGSGIDDETLDLLTSDVFAYMGRPVQQHRPVFSQVEIRGQYREALVGAWFDR
jgi:alcohol dehydrogenase class IV